MTLIAGPCVIESRDALFKIADKLSNYKDDNRVDFYFKASFDKANRTSLDSFRGPGLDEGLKLLEFIKKEFGYKILTDIHETSQVNAVAEVADVLQIPAFLCRQTDLLVRASQTNRVVNIKKGQFMNPEDMQYSALKVLKNRDAKYVDYQISKDNGLWLTERGSSFGYGNLVVDMRGLVIMRNFAPVIFDATHSVQMPGGAGGVSSGNSEYIPYLARAAAGVGVDGFFFETHFDPASALSDASNMLDIDTLNKTVNEILMIREVLK